MIPTLAIVLGLGLQANPAVPPQSGTTLDKRLAEMQKAKDWGGLADTLEALAPAERKAHSYELLDALKRSARWPRLLEFSDLLLAGHPGAGERPMLRLFRGRALSELGRHREALACYLEPGDRWDLGCTLEACFEASSLGDWKTLLELGNELVTHYPTSGEFLATKGEALAKLGRYAEAEPTLQEAVALAPGRAMAWADLACCLNEREEYQEAFQAASKARALDPRLVEAACNRGRACLGLKRYKEARADLATALALGPKDPALVKNLKVEIAAADAYLAYLASHPGKPGR